MSHRHAPCPDFETDQTGMVHVQSGGSTGEPKQLRRPIQTWVTSAQLEAQAFGLSAHDRFAVLGNPSHSLWGYVHFRAAQLAAPCVGLSALDISAWSASALQQWNAVAPTVLYGVPELVATFIRQLQRHAQPALNVRVVLLGGGPVLPTFPIETVKFVFPNASLWSFYGTAETSFIGYRRLEAPTYTLFPSVELDIRATQDGGDIGEIWVRGPMTITPKDWVNTGDLGGSVYGEGLQLVGRAARQLVVKGETYFVEPLEEALMRCFGFVHLVLMIDAKGRLCCLMARADRGLSASDDEASHNLSLARINETIHFYDPRFPGVRRMIQVAVEDWPLTPVSKTNYKAFHAWL